MPVTYLGLAFGGARSGRTLDHSAIASRIAEQLRAPGSAGARLPPARVLAQRLGVPLRTVTRAYAALETQGLVSRGSARDAFAVAKKPRGSMRFALARAPELKPAPALPTAPPRPQGLLQLGSVFIDPRLLPREALEECFHAALSQKPIAPLGEPQGYAPLRAEIAKHLRARGFDADAGHVITTVGSQQALDLVARSLRKGPVATENPAYQLGKALLHRSGARPLGLRIDPFSGVDVEQWERVLERKRPRLLYLTTRYQNPTGYSYRSAELDQILRWSRRYGCGILEDDWASDMLPGSEYGPSLRALGGPDVLYMNSFTKKVWPALRLGFVLASEATVPALRATKRVAIGSCPALGEVALHAFLERGYYETHLKRLQPELQRRYDHCLQLMRRLLPDDIRWTTPGGGPALWVECPRSVDLDRVAKDLRDHDVLLPLPRADFFGRPHLHGFKLGYASIACDEMTRALELLGSALHVPRTLSSRSRSPARGKARPEHRQSS